MALKFGPPRPPNLPAHPPCASDSRPTAASTTPAAATAIAARTRWSRVRSSSQARIEGSMAIAGRTIVREKTPSTT